MSDVFTPTPINFVAEKAWTKPPCKLVAIASGKGGVGKTFVAANLAAALSKRGHRVLVLDADLGLANLDVVLNLQPKVGLHDIFKGKATLAEAIVRAPGGFSVLLAGSGMMEYSRLTHELRNGYTRIVADLMPHYDIILLDTSAGISDVVLFTVSLATEVLMVTTPEPTSLTNAYATIKVLVGQQQRNNIHIMVNQTERLGDGRAITQQLQQLLNRFVITAAGCPVHLRHMNDIPYDPSVRQAMMQSQLLLQSMPGCPAALAISQLASKVEIEIFMQELV